MYPELAEFKEGIGMADLTKKTMKIIRERDEGICKLCHLPVTDDDWNIDHIIPQSHGGKSYRSNLRLTHKECNRLRGDDLSEDERNQMVADQLAKQENNCYVCGEHLKFSFASKVAPDYRLPVSWGNMALAHSKCRASYNRTIVQPWNSKMSKLKGTCIRRIIGIE